MLGKEIPELMKLIQKEEAQAVAKQKTEAPIKGVWNINMVITLTSYFVWKKWLLIKNQATST